MNICSLTMKFLMFNVKASLSACNTSSLFPQMIRYNVHYLIFISHIIPDIIFKVVVVVDTFTVPTLPLPLKVYL